MAEPKPTMTAEEEAAWAEKARRGELMPPAELVVRPSVSCECGHKGQTHLYWGTVLGVCRKSGDRCLCDGWNPDPQREVV